MNRDINIILTTAETVDTAVDFVEGLGRIRKGVGTDSVKYTFPWKKLGAVSRDNGVAGAEGEYTITPGALAANTEYSFYLTQVVDGETITEKIVFVSGDTAPATPDVVCDAWRAVVAAHVNAGRLAIDIPAAGAVTLDLDASSVDNYNLTAVEISLAGVAEDQAPVAPVGRGADLLAAGVVDSFPEPGSAAALPTASLYNLYTFELMMPKGNGGFNEQTSDQAVLLKVYADQASGTSGALDTVVDSIIAGTYTAAELLGSDV